MKPKHILFSLILLFFCLNSHSADNYQIGDILYVWAKSGLNIRSAPKIGAKKIGKLSHGDKVEIQEITNQTYNIKGFEQKNKLKNYLLKGKWIKISNKEFEGYIVDTYLLKYSPPKERMNFLEYLKSFSEKSLDLDTTRNLKYCDPGECFFAKVKTQNGMEFQVSLKSAEYTEALYIPDMTIEEGFIFSEYFTVVLENIGSLLEQPTMELSHNLADRLIIRQKEGIEIRYVNQGNKLRISVKLNTHDPIYKLFRPDLYKVKYGSDSHDLFKIDLISEKEFQSIKGKGLETDSKVYKKNLYSKIDKVITVKLGNGESKIIKDKGSYTYYYEGHYDKLGAFKISGQGWESYEFDLYDSYSGKSIAFIGESFFVSPKLNYLISFTFDIYNEGTEFTFKKLTKENRNPSDSLKEDDAEEYYFSNWTITRGGKAIWENNQTFVLPIHIKPYPEEEDEDAYKYYRYARFRILR